MSAYEPEKLWSLWKREQITSEMAIGHILQNLVLQHEAIRQLNLLVKRLQGENDRGADQDKAR